MPHIVCTKMVRQAHGVASAYFCREEAGAAVLALGVRTAPRCHLRIASHQTKGTSSRSHAKAGVLGRTKPLVPPDLDVSVVAGYTWCESLPCDLASRLDLACDRLAEISLKIALKLNV